MEAEFDRGWPLGLEDRLNGDLAPFHLCPKCSRRMGPTMVVVAPDEVLSMAEGGS